MNVIISTRSPIIRTGLELPLMAVFEKNEVIFEKMDNLTELIPDSFNKQVDLAVFGFLPNDSETYVNAQLKEAMRLLPGTRIIVCDTGSSQEVQQRVPLYLRYGAMGYMSIKDSIEVVKDCFRTVLSGRKFLNQEALVWLIDSYIGSFAGSKEKKILTKNEMIVAQYLIRGERITSIANETNRKTSTISTIKKNIFRKTDTKNIVELREFMKTDVWCNI